MLKLYKRDRDKHWKIRGTIHGVNIEESTGLADKAQAQLVCDARIAEINRQHVAGVVLGRRPAPSFAQAVIDYVEKGGERRFLAPLLDLFGERPIDQITQADIDDAVKRILPGRAPATLNRQIYGPMSAVLKKAGATITVERRPETKREPRYLTKEEAARLVEASNINLQPLVLFLLLTGARIGEALWLDWRFIDLPRAHVTFPRTKNGDPRGLPLHRDVVAALASLPHREGEIFLNRYGLPYERLIGDNDEDTSAGTRIAKPFKTACRDAGITNLRVHDLRHTWASWHYQAHRDLLALKEAGGWRSIKMVERYAHINREHLREEIEALPSLRFG